MKKIPCLLFLFFFTLYSPCVYAQTIEFWNNASDGFRSQGKVRLGQAAPNPSVINPYQADNQLAKLYQDRVGESIEKLMSDLKTRVVLVSSDRQIVHQSFATKSMQKATPLGFSMSKSLTAMTVGHVLCANPTISIDQRVDTLIPKLAGSSWGNSTIKDLLLMKSGAARQDPSRHGWQSEAVAVTHRPIYWGKHNSDFLDMMIKDDLKEFKPGTKHYYSNYDTLALGFVVEAISGKKFHEYFFNTIWREISTANTGAWLVNSYDQTLTAYGFSATPEDWLRIGHYVVDQIRSNNCLGKFLKKAIEPVEYTHHATRCYGFQIWNWCRTDTFFLMGKKDSFFFLGFGGQHLIVNPNKRWVAYVHQISEENNNQLIFLLRTAMYL